MNNAELPYKEDERLVKWRVRGSNGVWLTWNLRFKDRYNAGRFVKAIPEISTVNEAVSSDKVDTGHTSGNTLPKPLITNRDDDIPSSEADTHENIWITDDHSSNDNDQLILSRNTIHMTKLVQQNVIQIEQHRKKKNKSENLLSMGDSSGNINPTPQHSRAVSVIYAM